MRPRDVSEGCVPGHTQYFKKKIYTVIAVNIKTTDGKSNSRIKTVMKF